MSYSYKDYWTKLHQREDLSSVGQSTLPGGMNKWIYRSIRRNMRRFAKRHGLTSGGGRMLEVGVGTGYWVDFWERLGWTVDGCDLVPAAVERLEAARPGSRFWAADVGAGGGLLSGSPEPDERYDLVTATSVLLHVTADDAFANALANVAEAVRPGGHLLLVEPVLTHKKKGSPYTPEVSSRARLRRAYVRPLREHGLELVTIEATTVLAANPLEARSPRRMRAYKKWWRLVLKSRKRPALAHVVGPLMFAGDAVLTRTSEAPTSKIMLFRKSITPSSETDGA